MAHLASSGGQNGSYHQLFDESDRTHGFYPYTVTHVEAGVPSAKQRPTIRTSDKISLAATIIVQAAWIAIIVMVATRWKGWDSSSTSDKICLICGPLILVLGVASEIRFLLLWRKCRQGI